LIRAAQAFSEADGKPSAATGRSAPGAGIETISELIARSPHASGAERGKVKSLERQNVTLSSCRMIPTGVKKPGFSRLPHHTT
jgi:hypothetical protein